MLKKQLRIKLVENDKKTIIFIRPETYETSRLMKLVYAQTYKELIDRQVATKSSMLDILKNEGIWTENHENQLTNLSLELAILESSFNKEGLSPEQEKEVVIKLSKTRRRMIDLINIKTEPLAYVAESMAEEIVHERYLVESTYYEDGRKYFKDYENFKNRRGEENTQKIIDVFFKELSEPSTKVYMDFPENKWLMRNGMMTKEGNVTDETIVKELVNEQVEPIKESKVELVGESSGIVVELKDKDVNINNGA